MTLPEIADQLVAAPESIVLVYAFNATGKTRLSVAYKDATKTDGGRHIGVYYNAFSEDLFRWDNDQMRLEIKHSSLNLYHASLKEQDIRQRLTPYRPKYEFYFDLDPDPERGITAITFFVPGEEQEKAEESGDGADEGAEDRDQRPTPIKISRGEERMFVWCFFLALFDVSDWADEQDAHFFIDDPVSSLDEHNLFVTAETLYQLIEQHLGKRKIIITSHHFGMMTILSDWLSKGEHASKFVNRNKTKKYGQYFMERRGDEVVLINPRQGVALYHLRLLQLLDDAVTADAVQSHHFALLRQVLENVGSFLGVPQFGQVLKRIGISNDQQATAIVNALSHQKVYYYQSSLPRPDDVRLLVEVMQKLKATYDFVLHTANS
jgi:hypothetical protein